MKLRKEHTSQQSRGIKKTVTLLALVAVALFLWSVFLVLQQTHV